MSRTLVVATRNAGKVRELEIILGCSNDLRLKSLDDYSDMPEIVEDGFTFEENARIKALAAARELNLPSCADDSGLSVPVLGGQPGIRSARFAGDDADDEANNALLLERMDAYDDPGDRLGYFVCAAALAMPSAAAEEWGIDIPEEWDFTAKGEAIWSAEARVPGILLRSPRGDNGFGYDPLLFHEQSGKTFAEMTLEEKNKVSHRGLAFRMLAEELNRALGDSF